MKKEKISWFFRIWHEGKYVDLWNIPHLLISLLICFTFIYLNLSFISSILLIIFLKASWEIFEHKFVTFEAIPNKILDVITGILAVVVAFYLKNLQLINSFTIILTLILEIIFALWGLYSMKKLNLFIKRK
jgi:hypothetical protein